MLSAVLVIAPMSCEDALDVNTDPLAATTADPSAVLPFVFVQYGARKTTELGTRTLDVTQFISNTFNSPKRGNTSIFLTGNTWGMYYTLVLGNLLLLKNDAVEAGPTSNNIAAVATIMQALSFYELASIWDDVPFTQALNGKDFEFPEFDSQETVFKGSVALLDEAMALIDAMPEEGNFNLVTGDLIYGGDMDNWARFANSLKLRILMLIRNRDTSVDGAISATLGQPLIETNSQAALFRYPGTPGQINGWKDIIQSFFAPTNELAELFGPSPVFRDLLVNNNDPRVDVLFFDPTGTGVYTAPEYGSFPVAGEALINDNALRADMPNIWFLPSEVSFYRSELALLGVVADDANARFEDGVRQHSMFWGGVGPGSIPGAEIRLDADDIEAFIASLPDLGGLSDADALNQLYEQMYVEAFMRSVYAWNHVRRTGVPDLQPPPGASISTILKRFDYPPDEVGANPNTPSNLTTDTPVWFEKP